MIPACLKNRFLIFFSLCLINVTIAAFGMPLNSQSAFTSYDHSVLSETEVYFANNNENKSELRSASVHLIKKNNNTFKKVRTKNYCSCYFNETKCKSSLIKRLLNLRRQKFVNLAFLKFLITSKMLC